MPEPSEFFGSPVAYSVAKGSKVVSQERMAATHGRKIETETAVRETVDRQASWSMATQNWSFQSVV